MIGKVFMLRPSFDAAAASQSSLEPKRCHFKNFTASKVSPKRLKLSSESDQIAAMQKQKSIFSLGSASLHQPDCFPAQPIERVLLTLFLWLCRIR